MRGKDRDCRWYSVFLCRQIRNLRTGLQCLSIRRTQNSRTYTLKFTYYFELDIDPEKDMAIRFCKRGQDIAGFSFQLDPQDWKTGIFVLPLSNLITFPKSNHTLNLFDAHIKSDTVIFDYTTTEGKQNVFKFPLTGFNEKYLEQFI